MREVRERAVDFTKVDVSKDDEGKTELFIGRISHDTDEETLRRLFEKHGKLVKCKHLYNKGVCFVDYETHDSAVRAIAACNGAEIDGANIQVQFSGDKPGNDRAASSGKPGESNTVFCGNCSFRTEEWAIKEFFEAVGPVSKIRIALNEEGRPKGFAHVEFENPSDAAKAVQ